MATSRTTSKTTKHKTSSTARTKAASAGKSASDAPETGGTRSPAARRRPATASVPAAKPAGAESSADAAQFPQDTALRKRELIATVVEKTGVKKRFAKPVVEAMIDEMGAALAEGRELNLQPFGKVKQSRTKDSSNARVIFAKIRQSKSASAGPDDGTDGKETVADAAE